MKNPKALFPFLFASSWFGNLVLTLLAFYLAFSHAGPLTPLVFLTVAVCILSGNALPIGVYLILVRWNEAELRAEAAEANVRLRDALARSEEVMGRLDEAEGALAKSIIVARQVPERISEQFKPLVDLSERFEDLELTSFTEALASQSEVTAKLQQGQDALQSSLGELQAGLKEVRKDLKDVPAAMGKLLEKAEAHATAREPDELDVSVGERLDLVFETLETVQDSLDGLLQRVAEIQLPAAGPDRPVEPEQVEPEPEPEPEPAPEKKAAGKRGRKEAVADDVQAEMQLEAAAELPADAGDGKTRLVVHAMVGINNKLFIRGDEPWLSWEDGQQMELIGIGEYAWAIDELKEPIEVTILLNDEVPAEEGTIRLEPGQTVHSTPRFPR